MHNPVKHKSTASLAIYYHWIVNLHLFLIRLLMTLQSHWWLWLLVFFFNLKILVII